MGILEWPTNNIFKHACMKKEEIDKDCKIIKAENTVGKEVEGKIQKDEGMEI